MKRWLPAALAAIALSCPAAAPRDGVTIELTVDARHAPAHLLHIREHISSAAPITSLHFAKWIPGEHGPTGPVEDLAGLRVSAGGTALRWRRDPGDLYAFTIDNPTHATSVDVSFDFLLASTARRYPERVIVSPLLAFILWHETVLYPSAHAAARIRVVPSLLLPEGWSWASSLRARAGRRSDVDFDTVSLETLVDAPVLTGRFLRSFDLAPGQDARVTLHAAADADSCLAVHPDLIAAYGRMTREARALFGAPPFEQYHVLVSLSDIPTRVYKEHAASCECLFAPDELRAAPRDAPFAAMAMAHEYVHAWNGKLRVPAGMTAGDFTATRHFDLLWIYEGLTTYLGWVVMVRSGLLTPDQFRTLLFGNTAWLAQRSGRRWRSLEDVAISAPLVFGGRDEWSDWRRPDDFYAEAALVWFEADALIRERTGNARSLDDFCRAFFAQTGGTGGTRPYTLPDVLAALHAVCALDWKTFFRERVADVHPDPPSGGLTRSGWSYALTAVQPAPDSAITGSVRTLFTLGAALGDDGTVQDIARGSAADRAGLAPGMRMLAVNGVPFTQAVVMAAIDRSASDPSPIVVDAVNGAVPGRYRIDYHGGPLRSVFSRIPGTPDLLPSIAAPRVARR